MRIEPPWSPPIAISTSPDADQRAAARRGAARRVAVLEWIVHRAERRCMTAARQAEVLAMRLADDRAAGIEDAGDHRRVDVGHIAFERRGAVHHRHAGETDIVLQHHALARQRAVGAPRTSALHRPGVERVFGCARPIARRARIAHRRQIVGQLVDAVVGRTSLPGRRGTRDLLSDMLMCSEATMSPSGRA